jgi:tetratricopeptide (TPR) repeat protein
LSQAAAAATSALTYQSDYAAAHLARGRVLLAMNQIPEAVQALTVAARVNPLPEYQWALADALRLEGLEVDARRVEQELAGRGAAADPRTLALYLATRRAEPARAIALAEDELETRADVFTLDAHAWALAANGRHLEARDVIRRATAEGTQDARLFLHAGVIHLATGHVAEAKRWLRKADRLRATLLPSEVTELAKSLSQTL